MVAATQKTFSKTSCSTAAEPAGESSNRIWVGGSTVHRVSLHHRCRASGLIVVIITTDSTIFCIQIADVTFYQTRSSTGFFPQTFRCIIRGECVEDRTF